MTHVAPGRAIDMLIAGHWYDAATALINQAAQESAMDRSRLARAGALTNVARQVLDLDAEDFSALAAGFDASWADLLAQASFPAAPCDRVRGALGSLDGLYRLMLEVLELRALRREPVQIVLVAHLIGEYLVQLAWEPTLHHAVDPLRMATSMAGSKWGTDDASCPHPSAIRTAARRSLTACNGDVVGYTAYLDRFHSRLGEALSICGLDPQAARAGERPDVGEGCLRPCDFARTGGSEARRERDARIRLAMIYRDGPLVALRHHAPVGHFFGVPSGREIADAWSKTWQKLTQQWRDGDNPLAGEPVGAAIPSGSEPLPGLARMISVIAGHPITAGHLIKDIGAQARQVLSNADQRSEPDTVREGAGLK